MAGQEHAEAIGAVICDAISRTNAKDYPPAEIERLLRNFSTGKIRDLLGTRQTLDAIVDGRVVGTGAIQGIEVKSVFVSPDWHRKGIGSSVVRKLGQRAESQGIETLEVSSSLSAEHFYKALGYIEQSRSFFGDEETILMSKSLGKAGHG